MARRQGDLPKVQRGISLPRDLYERIKSDAIRLDITFNAAVEGVLRRAYPCDPSLQDAHEKRHDAPASGRVSIITFKGVPDDDD